MSCHQPGSWEYTSSDAEYKAEGKLVMKAVKVLEYHTKKFEPQPDPVGIMK